jgi:hypothetical protein
MDNLLRDAMVKGYKRLPFTKIYRKYKTTNGLAKSVCAELMVNTLTNESKFIVEDDIDEFLNTVELDSLWHLAIDCKNPHVKDEAKRKVIAILVSEDNKEILDEKIELDNNAELEENKVLSLHK